MRVTPRSMTCNKSREKIGTPNAGEQQLRVEDGAREQAGRARWP